MKFTLFLTCICALIINDLPAQIPQAMNYQAVARNSSGVPLQNQLINVRFSIKDSIPTGTIIYQETDTITTNQFGLFAVKVGTGVVTAGAFSNIDWSVANKYLEVELDPTGGQSFTEMGNQELLSVPYALYAQAAGGYNNPSAFNHYVGQLFGGGIVVAVWKDTLGTEHGLVASAVDVATQVAWSNVNTLIGATAESADDGASNTAAIIAQSGQTSSAALLCHNYNGGGYTDWYLPSIMELNQCCISSVIVNRVLGSNGFEGQGGYWSSTEYPNNNVWYQYFPNPYDTNPPAAAKNSTSPSVRAVRVY